MGPLTFEQYRFRAWSLGYSVFESNERPYNLNIVGFRNFGARPNYFDDWLSVYWKGAGSSWMYLHYPITTYPGIPWLLNPMNENGTAIMVPGQYEGAYALGLYKNYIALKQVKPIKVFRDKNKDSQFNLHLVTIEKGLFGVHIHRAGFWSKVVGLSSAGCQVFKNKVDFDAFIFLCKKAAKNWGNHFTYTLMDI